VSFPCNTQYKSQRYLYCLWKYYNVAIQVLRSDKHCWRSNWSLIVETRWRWTKMVGIAITSLLTKISTIGSKEENHINVMS
jgi:hypothetical protein